MFVFVLYAFTHTVEHVLSGQPSESANLAA